MDSKENYDEFNIIADTIVKWYEQTHTAMTVTVNPPSHLDVELMGILLASKQQTLGALTTLVNKHILSTHALLRILLETYAVLLWAFNAPIIESKTKSEEVFKRLRRWDYTRLKKDKMLLENLTRTPEIDTIIEKAEADIEKLRKDGIKELPNTKQLYDDLGKEWKSVYANFYMRYCRAVHLNRNITQKLAWIQKEEEKAKAILYQDDIEPDGDELITIVRISVDINKAIRDFYGWQLEAIQNEYKQVESRLNNK